MPVIPWKMAEAPLAGNRYLALISYLPLKHFRAIPNFFRFTSEIRRQLRVAPGLIGYSLDARPFARTFWTLSVWRDEQSLTDFVNQAPHNRITLKLATPWQITIRTMAGGSGGNSAGLAQRES